MLIPTVIDRFVGTEPRLRANISGGECFWCADTAKYIHYIPRVPQCLSPRLVGIRTPQPPLPLSSTSTPEPRSGEHARLRVRGWGSPNSDDWRKSLSTLLQRRRKATLSANSSSHFLYSHITPLISIHMDTCNCRPLTLKVRRTNFADFCTDILSRIFLPVS
jgi:hypothetical protein